MVHLPTVLRGLLFSLAALIIFTLSVNLTRADCHETYDENVCQQKIDQQNAQLSSIQKQQADLQKQLDAAKKNLNSTTAQLNALQKQVDDIRAQLAKAEADLKDAQKILDQNKSLFRARVRDFYISTSISGWELLFGGTYSFSDAAQTAGLKQAIVNKNKNLIVHYTTTVSNLDATRSQIAESEKTASSQLSQIQAIRAAQANQVGGITRTQGSLNNQAVSISTSLQNLSARQKEIIASKTAQFSAGVGSLPPADDPNSRTTFDPGFRPAFAAFSFGGYTHRNGMSQYGALGRANRGQTTEQILSAYYPAETLNTNYPVPQTIYVNGTNEYGQTFNCQPYSLSDYVKRLYEVPSSWPTAVLRAQAVAARSYAIRYINTTGNRCTGADGQQYAYICPSQSCQVVKFEINATSWQTAVNDTATWVLSGGPGNFQYSSTSGGYLNTSSWDSVCETRDCWPTDAYESIGGSPWFYKGWYTDLGKSSGDFKRTCGRSHPWLNQTEMTDILNAWVVQTKGTDADRSRIAPYDAACWGGSPYTYDEMRSRAASLGGAYTSISSAPFVLYNTGGYTGSVTFSTNLGVVTIDGPTFKDIFNTRSPAKIGIQTPLFNIESKF